MRNGPDLGSLLARNRELRARYAGDAALAGRLAALRRWQAERLAATYADLAAQGRYRAAVTFFLRDLYGGADAGPRDRELARAARALTSLLPAAALEALCAAVVLDSLTQELDAGLAARLPPGQPVTGAAYAAAYRATGRRAERERQIAAILELGHCLDGLVRQPLPRLLLRVSRRPAQLAGLGALHDYLERGFQAFTAMDGAAEFLTTIGTRESELLRRLFDGEVDPFTTAELARQA